MAPRRQKKSKKVLSPFVEELRRQKIVLPVWLVFVLNMKLFPGLVWNDRKEGIFCVSNTHQRSNQWDQDVVAHCVEWSLIKNTYCPEKEIRIYKASFRTALNSKGKRNKEQIKKIGKIKDGGDWIKYQFVDKSFLSREPDPFLLEYYSARGLAGKGESSVKKSLPPFSAEFRNSRRTVHERQDLGQQEPTTLQKDVQSSIAKRTKPVRNQICRTKKPKGLVQKPRVRKNATSTTSQNSPDNTLPSENCFLPINGAVKPPPQFPNQMTPEPQVTDVHFIENEEMCFSSINEAVQSPLHQYENQMTPEPQYTDVHLKENEGQNLHCYNHEIYPTYTENQPYTPRSSYGDREAFPPSYSYVPSNTPNSFNCIYNLQQNLFHHSMPNTGDQNDCAPLYHQLQPPYHEGQYDTSLTIPLLPNQTEFCNYHQSPSCNSSPTSQDLTISLEHLPDYKNEESFLREILDLIAKRFPHIQEELSILETDYY